MPIRVAIPDYVSPSYFPALAAVELGFFRKEGVDATCELLYPVARSYELLRDGTLDLVGGASHAVPYAFPDWDGAVLLGALARNMYWFLVVRSDARVQRGNVTAVKGMRIGAAPGPIDGLRAVLRASGIDPDADVELVPVPGATTPGASFGVAAAQALEARRIDGFWANGMATALALRSGAGTLILDARRGDGPSGSTGYTFPALVASAARLAKDPAFGPAAVRALRAAQQALKDDPERAAEVGRRVYPAVEAGLIAELIRRDAPFYDVAITAGDFAEIDRFGGSLGITRGGGTYDAVVPPAVRALWG